VLLPRVRGPAQAKAAALNWVPEDLAKRTVVLAIPAVLTLSHIVGVWSSTAGHWANMTRPAIIGLALSLAVLTMCWLILRRIGPTVAAASMVIVILAGAWYAGVVVLGVGLGATYAYWHWLRTRQVVRISAAGPAAFVLLLLAITVGKAVAEGAVVPGDLDLVRRHTAVAQASRPSIYVLLLDGYPRADTLDGDFGIDNRPFIQELTGLGFTHYEDATSPATRTELTLLAMLGGEWDGSIQPGIDRELAEWRSIRAALNTAPAMDVMADHGYWRVYIPSPVAHSALKGWDTVIDTGQISQLEARLLQRSLLAPFVANIVVDQQRDRLVDSLEAVKAQAVTAGQKVVMAHLMAPHPPLFSSPSLCWAQRACGLFEVRPSHLEMSLDEYVSAFAAQIETVNSLVLETLRSVVRTDPDATVVVMSDHGARIDETNRDEWRRSLLAVRGTDALDSDHSVRDLFNRLLADDLSP